MMKTTLVLVFLTGCHIFGILLFCKGFLLKRVVIPQSSECSLPLPPTDLPSCSGQTRRYKRVVWLLIDALRYDFMLWDHSLEDPPPVYRNKMPYVRDLLNDQPSNAKLFKFIADPPTTTMQRLKALTTGGLPTFVDIGANFNSYEIQEDNIIQQMSRNGRNVTFMGDDTWLGLYPGKMSTVYPYPSLNVKDIHTVDNGVLSHLYNEIKSRDSDLLIGHFLGVDHIGHTSGPSHWTMGDKLTQMDKMINEVVNAVDDESLVLVFGDHGMTSTGDHGGETDLETNAALLVYSKLPLFNQNQLSGGSVYQIDIVPTVALLLGVPVPFSNLGMVIPELFMGPDGTHEDLDLLSVLRTNAEQVHQYLTTYVEFSGDFPTETFQRLAAKFESLQSQHNGLSLSSPPDELTLVRDGYFEYMRQVNEMCHQVWAKFDDQYIWAGILLVALALLAIPGLVETGNLSKSILISGGLSLVLSIILTNFNVFSIDFVLYSAYATLVLMLVSCIPRGLLKLMNLLHCLNALNTLAIVLVILHAVSLLSNSFVLYEPDMISFFVQTLLFCLAFKRLALGGLLNSLLPYLALSVSVRVSKLFYSCRDLQYQDGCQETSFTQSYTIAADALGSLINLRFILSYLAVVAFPACISRALTRQFNFLNTGAFTMLTIGIPLAGLCVCLHWGFQILPPSYLSYWHHVIPPWVVYSICICTILAILRRPFTRAIDRETALAFVLVVIAMCLWVPLSLLLNDGLALSASLILIQALLSFKVLSTADCPLVVCVFWCLLSSHSFFVTGHTTTITSLRFEAGFTGIHGEINKYNLPLAGILVGLNTLGSQIVYILVSPILLILLSKHSLTRNRLLKLALLIIAINSIKLLVTLVTASIHRRHLMVWQVFTPRVLYEGAFQVTTDCTLLLISLVYSLF